MRVKVVTETPVVEVDVMVHEAVYQDTAGK